MPLSHGFELFMAFFLTFLSLLETFFTLFVLTHKGDFFDSFYASLFWLCLDFYWLK